MAYERYSGRSSGRPRRDGGDRDNYGGYRDDPVRDRTFRERTGFPESWEDDEGTYDSGPRSTEYGSRRTRSRARAEACRRRKRQLRIYRTMAGAAAAIILFAVSAALWLHASGSIESVQAAEEAAVQAAAEAAAEEAAGMAEAQAAAEAEQQAAEEESAENESGFFAGYSPERNSVTASIPEDADVTSEYAVMIDLDTGDIIAERNSGAVIYPASMTKILTVLTAADTITPEQLDDSFVITQGITDYVFSHDCSAVNWDIGERVTVRDLLYGTILESGGDAALGLAVYCAGSEEAFVERMNEKARSLGLGETAHFTTCIGIFNEENHCTVVDMAMILKAAVENPLLREVLSARSYTTSATAEHADGITISNWFLRRIEDKETGGTVECAKTGFVNQSGNCAASFAVSDSGKNYICVTANTWSAWRCIYDHVAMYSAYMR